MRDIKFEYGFNSVNGIVKKVYYLHEIPNIKDKCDVWNVLPIAYVREYTGLKDKNGKDIYEGDVYSAYSTDDKYKIFFKNGAFCGGKSIESCAPIGWDLEGEHDAYTGEMIEGVFVNEIEVIGNIYENPELLK